MSLDTVAIEISKQEGKALVRALTNVGYTTLAGRIQEQLPKPKPDAPNGLGAVVRTRDGKLYVRAAGCNVPGSYHYPSCNDWHLADGGSFNRTAGRDRNGRHSWLDLDVVEVLSQGVPGVGG